MSEITVLIIDEHTALRELLARRLGAHPPFRVVAHTGNALLGSELAWFWEPDVILIDLKASGCHAADLYRKVSRASPGSRLVVFTSYVLDREEQSFRKAGVAKCLLKGMSFRALSQELRHLVAEKPRAGA
ncbi:MAG TPA: response regulator [Dehalococcoidia bacterium]|nr:response regulator [Dehalococcoidia bacterium]